MDATTPPVLQRIPLVEEIQQLIIDVYEISGEQLFSRCRLPYIVWPRHVAMYLVYELTDLSLIEVGRHFRRDHPAVLNAVRNVRKKRNLSPDFAQDLAALVQALKP